MNTFNSCGIRVWLLKSVAFLKAFSSVVYSQTPTPLTLTSGRIAISHDGNIWDKDDVLAFAMDWAVMASFGVQNKLVHMEHSVIKCPNAEFASAMKEAEKGWKYFPGFDSSVVFDAWVNVDATVAHFKAEAEKSSANNRLYFLLAGPMEIPWRGINAVSKEKRQCITVISHSIPNDKMGSCATPSHLWADLKSSFQADGVQFVNIPDQNANLGGIGSSKWNFLLTMPINPLIPDAGWKWLKGRDFKANGSVSDYQARFTNPLKGGTTTIAAPRHWETRLSKDHATVTYMQKNWILQLTVNGMDTDGLISMYSLLSKKIFEVPMVSGQANLALIEIPSGKYFLNIESQGRKFSK